MATLYPATLSGKVLWLNPDNLSSIGTRMSTWADSVGATCAIQAGSAPIVAAGPEATRKAMLFDVGLFTYNVNLTGTSASGSEFWMLVKGFPGAQAGFRLGTSGSASHYPFSDGNVYDDLASTTRIAFNHGGAANAWNVLRVQVAAGGGTKTYWINGTQLFQTTTVNPAQYRTDVLIGGGPGVSSNALISESIIFNRTLTTTEASNLLAYLQNLRDALGDNFADAGVLSVGGSNFSPATTVSALTTESGEPGSGTNSGWLYFDAPATSRYVVTTGGSTSDTLLNVYTGSSLGSLVQVASSDDEGGNGTSRLVLSTTAGTRYYLRVALKTGTAGTYRVSITSDDRWLEEVKLDSAVLAWTFANATIAAPLTDATGQGRDGVWGSGVDYNLDKRSVLSAFKGAFRGNSSAVITGPSLSWPTTGSVTIEGMILFDLYGRQQMIWSWVGASLDLIFHNSVPGYFGLNNLAVALHGPPLPVEGWHHLALVIPMGGSSGSVKYYIDGVLQTAAYGGTAFTIPALGTSSFRIGHNTGGWEVSSANESTGIAIFFTELSAARIMAHYRAAVGAFNDRLSDYQLIQPMSRWVSNMRTPAYDSSVWGVDAGEPSADVPTRTAWAAFDAPDGGTYQLDTIGSTYDTSVAVYTMVGSALSLVAADSSSGGSNNAKVIWTATAGTRYYLQVGASPSASPDSGTIYPRLSVYTEPATGVSPAHYSATRTTPPAFLLKGRSTKVFDALPGG